MPTLPPTIIRIVSTFAPLFSRRVFRYVEVLLAGAILTPGRRTVTNVLRIMGLQHSRQFQTYHRVLTRAHWSSREAAQLLLGVLVGCFAPDGPIVMGSMKPWNDAKERTLRPKASIAMRHVRARRSSSRRAACGGSA